MAARALTRISGCFAARKSVQASCMPFVRCLNLHEHDSKGLLAQHNVRVQRFKVATTAAEAKTAADDILTKMGAKELVLKAQILAGGRGKGTLSSGLTGGVKVTKSVQDVHDFSEKMLGYRLMTKQTPPEGVLVRKVMVAEAFDISRETYFAILMDRTAQGPVLVGSPEGGVDIEEVAAKTPHLIYKVPVDIVAGPDKAKILELAANLNFTGKLQEEAAQQMLNLYDLFLKMDATQVEINPFGETPDGEVVCFDAKITFDDNAKFRQKDVFALEDSSETDPQEAEAVEWGLNYIRMDGNIGCLVNGAGLAMATMDIIKLHGGEPANFLDVGGSASESQITQAFKIISTDPKVKSILVNIFGGIVDCTKIAGGVIAACKETGLKLPLVVRLAGNNAEKAREMLDSSGLAIQSANHLSEAAVKAVATLS